jgi:hypothetical protein
MSYTVKALLYSIGLARERAALNGAFPIDPQFHQREGSTPCRLGGSNEVVKLQKMAPNPLKNLHGRQKCRARGSGHGCVKPRPRRPRQFRQNATGSRNGGARSIRVRRILRAKPSAGKAGSAKTRDEIGALTHETPDEAGAVIFDHQENRPLVDSKVIRRYPEP